MHNRRPAAAILAALLLAAGVGLGPGARVAGAEPQTVDRVVAVVGDRPILLSILEEEFRLFRLQDPKGEALPDSALRARALARLIDDRLVLAKADEQGISVTEEEVDGGLDATLRDMRSQFGTDEAFREQLAREGLTEASFRERYRDDVRNELRGRRLVEKEVKSKVEVSDEDLARFYELHKEQIPLLPLRYEVAQIVVRVKPNEGARSEATARIVEAQAALAKGETFEDVAKRLSEGPSAANGGELGTFRPGQMEEAFETAITALEPGQVSPPVATRVGIHLIRLDETREDGAFRAHHIVALFHPDPAARDSARARIDAAIAAIRGGADFAEIARTTSDDEATREKGGAAGLFALEQMPETYRSLVEGLSPGGLTEVVESDEGFVVFKLVRIDEPRRPTVDEVKRELREAVKEQKSAEDFAEWVGKLRKEIYVRIL